MAKVISSLLLCALWVLNVPHMAPAASQTFSVDRQRERPRSEYLNIEVKDGLISMDVHDADIAQVLTELAQKSNIAMTIDAELKGRVSIRLEDVPFEEALKQLSENRALVFEFDPGKRAYRIVGGAAFGESRGRTGIDEQTAPTVTGGMETVPPSAGSPGNRERQSLVAGGVSNHTLDSEGRPLYKTGELLVKFADEATAEQIDALHRAMGSQVLGAISRRKLQRVKLKQGLSEEEAIGLYSASPLVESVERHALRYLHGVPNDTYFDEQWGPSRIQAPEAWDITQGSPEVIIAVIDTGVDYLHPDLSDNMWTNLAELNGVQGEDDDENGYIDDIYGWDFAGTSESADDPDGDPIDLDGHGTHVAGIIAAAGNNEIGIAGVCWQAKLMALKVMADDADQIEEWDIINAVSYAMDNGARIVNCSFGGQGFNTEEYDAFADLRDAGILASCAAGNEAVDSDEIPNYPSSFDLSNIISVAASDQTDHLAQFTYKGSNWGSSSVDVMAPGDEIKSTVPPGIYTEARVTIEEDVSTVVYQAVGMVYAGTTDDDGVTRPVYDCGLGNEGNDFPPEVDGNIALIQRDRVVTFAVKTTNAQSAGAVAVIIYNNTTPEEPDDTLNFRGTLGAPGDWVPVVSISNRDGEDLKRRGLPETVSVVNKVDDRPSSYENKNGTSMAAPHVSGIAGLLLSVHPELDHQGLKAVILGTVDRIEPIDPGDDSKKILTNGRVNALRALLHAYLPGDVSGDNKVGLADTVLTLQVVGGLSPQICVSCMGLGVDVNGDGRIGMEEAVYSLRKIAELTE